jgi:hypothetical protein
MNQGISKVLVAAVFAIAVSVQFPSDLPEFAQVPTGITKRRYYMRFLFATANESLLAWLGYNGRI